MIRISKRKISANILALIFLLCPQNAPALQLTQTVYTIPEDHLDIFFKEEFHDRASYFSRERLGLGLGLFSGFSAWFSIDYIRKTFDNSEASIGDTSIKLWYYFGDFLSNTLHIGFLLEFNLPTGPNVYYNQKWAGLAAGRNELSPGIACGFDPAENIFLHFSLLYTFREGSDDNFYGGFHLDPTKSGTFTSLLGLNPFDEKAFLYKGRLRNDFFTLSAAVSSDKLYPFIPYAEAGASFRPAGVELEDGDSIVPFTAVLGGRYFFSRRAYIGLFAGVSPFPSDYARAIYGIDASALLSD